MITENLFEKVLLNPARASSDFLSIISAFSTPAMVYRHFAELPQKVKILLIIGMIEKNGIPRAYHQEFVKIAQRDYPERFECRYIIKSPPVHSKAYIWSSESSPKVAYIGSANYTQTAFSVQQREMLIESDPNRLQLYFKNLLKDSVNCLQKGIESLLMFIDPSKWPYAEEVFEKEGPKGVRSQKNNTYRTVTLSLLSSAGKIHQRAGLNWGQRPGREPNQAYIPIPSNISKSGFFPRRGTHFTIVTDDGETFDAVTAQQNNKAIETTLDNSILGRYFRKRLGVPLGDFVKATDLARYGRSSIEMRKLNQETYSLDFFV